MTKEPADWAKIKAHRDSFPGSYLPDEEVLKLWHCYARSLKELARMYDKYEQPPVDPDLLAAREYVARQHYTHPLISERVLSGFYDSEQTIKTFLAGIKHGRG